MNIKHVPSLELCQEFDTLCKEKGIVVPETEYCWMPVTMPPIDGVEYILAKVGKDCPTNYRYGFPAPLVSEQGEFLHKIFLRMKEERIVITDPKGRWNRIVKAVNIMENEANARMKCLNFLIAEGIITTL